MDGLRRWYESLDPWQRGTVATLALAVLVAGAVLAVALALQGAGPPDDASAGGPTTTTAATTTTGTVDSTTTTTVATTSTVESTTTSTEATTSTTTDPLEALTLDPDGLGPIAFGTPAGEALDGLRAVLGPPDEDTGWVEQEERYGTCIGDTVRFVRWSSLTVFLTDGASEWAPAGSRHFAAYGHSSAAGTPLDLATTRGVGIGTPAGDLRATYGDQVEVADDPLFGPWWRVDFPGAGFLQGSLSGLDAEDVVESVAAGESCGE